MPRTRAEMTILHNNIESLKIIRNEKAYAETIGVCIPSDIETLESLEQWIDEETETRNTTTDTDGTRHSLFDIRTSGTYICRTDTTNEYHGRTTPTKRDFYLVTLLDKWRNLLSLAYYQAHDFITDYQPIDNIVVPVSACDKPWILDER